MLGVGDKVKVIVDGFERVGTIIAVNKFGYDIRVIAPVIDYEVEYFD